VPSLADAIRFAEGLHARVPQLGLVGWDLAIDHEGRPVLLEWNTVHPGVHYNEALDRPNYVGEQWELLR
jgi:D-alanine-D-alanine ligase-like ATP-grasp enzyme